MLDLINRKETSKVPMKKNAETEDFDAPFYQV